MSELTTSLVARNNILNNQYAINELETHLQLGGLSFEGETVFTKAQVAQILEIDIRTIERYLSDYIDELQQNGYRVLKGKSLKKHNFIICLRHKCRRHQCKNTSTGYFFSFRAVLNLAMLVTESERAKFIRSKMLDIVIDVINQKKQVAQPNTSTKEMKTIFLVLLRKKTIGDSLQTL